MVELSGIAVGRSGLTKHQLQCAFLRNAGIPFIQNARGRPIVARSYFESSKLVPPPAASKSTWQPGVM
ncbi:DUF4224 domain-containing protein [Limnobacter sp. SAORIC-690]|uniref:DUF4224 domain-containing protein n=2 Tax=unclassified Limnobacter TaxID=2630203 RepID=UPI0035152468